MVHKLASSTRLRVSERCCAFYLERGTTDLTVAEIAGAAGVSDRTFYRYFPVKAESVAPVFDSMTATLDAFVVAHPALAVRERMIGGFRAMFADGAASRARELFPLVFADAEMWALFLRKVHDGETTLAPLLAEALGVPPEHDRARAAAAAVASATRIALERLSAKGADLTTEFVGLLDAFGPELLSPRPSLVSDGPTG